MIFMFCFYNCRKTKYNCAKYIYNYKTHIYNCKINIYNCKNNNYNCKIEFPKHTMIVQPFLTSYNYKTYT